jgi:hypothetical protein
MTKSRTMLIALLAGAAMLTGASSAAAHSGKVNTTDDGKPAGTAVFYEKGGYHYLKACDNQKDDAGVIAYASYFHHGKQNKAVDANGSGNKCGKAVRFKATRPVWVAVRISDKEAPNRPPYWGERLFK